MRVDRAAGRAIVVLLIIGGLAWVEAALHGSHFYRLTYGACGHLPNNPICGGWRTVALLRSAFVLAVGGALLIFNERRQPS
jgi:hypothetical protein